MADYDGFRDIRVLWVFFYIDAVKRSTGDLAASNEKKVSGNRVQLLPFVRGGWEG